MKKLNKKGFTLTELIVVIAVIAILAAVLIPTLTGYIEKARVSADNQEVAVLNKLMLDAKINEVEFKNVNELKKYLAEEMDYDGDYTLGVKDSYLWFDKESYEFVILNKNEVEGLQSVATKTYKRSSVLESPEGLLVTGNNNEYEVWLVGGKGEWVEAVEAIRNLGENDTVAKAIDSLNKALGDLGLADQGSQLLSKLAFVGSKGSYAYNGDSFEQCDDLTDKTKVNSEKIIALGDAQAEFFNKYITAVIRDANEQLASLAELVAGNQNPNGSYDITVSLKQLEENTGEQLMTILEAVTNLITFFYETNANDYSDDALELSVKPAGIAEAEYALPEDLMDLIDKLKSVSNCEYEQDDLLNNLKAGVELTTGDEESDKFNKEKFNTLFTILAALFVNKEFTFNDDANLGLIANKTNVVSISATFGKDLVVTYNFRFVG